MRIAAIISVSLFALTSALDVRADEVDFVQTGQKTVDGRQAPVWSSETAEVRAKYRQSFEAACRKAPVAGREPGCILYAKMEMEDRGFTRAEQIDKLCGMGLKDACNATEPMTGGPFASRESLEAALKHVGRGSAAQTTTGLCAGGISGHECGVAPAPLRSGGSNIDCSVNGPDSRCVYEARHADLCAKGAQSHCWTLAMMQAEDRGASPEEKLRAVCAAGHMLSCMQYMALKDRK